MARLVSMTEGRQGRSYDLVNHASIGRNSTQTVQILDRLCSKEHAILRLQGGQWTLRDLGSRNGTFVNGQAVASDHWMMEGDEITIGSSTLVFRLDSPTSSTSAGPAQSRVTLASDILRSAISASLSYTGEQDFRPAHLISDAGELRRDYEKLRMAYTLQRDISLEHDLEKLLPRILASLFANLECDRGAILLVTPPNDELVIKCVRSRNEDDTSEIRISDSVIREVVKGRKAIVSSNLLEDSRFDHAQSVILQGIRSSMSVPLLHREKVLGVIYLDSLIATNAFAQRDLELVEGLANQAALAIDNSVLMKQREEDIRVREKFSRLLSPRVVDMLVDQRVELTKGGASRISTVLFSDLRGFTSMSERLGPEEIVAMLNEYFELMVEVLFEFEGTLDKYMGDGLMAVFGSPVDIEEAPLKAVAAALRMREALAQYNVFRRADGKEALNVGIGIDTGPLVAGYMGSSKTMNYTVIGPPVNLASRLCGAAQATEILISNRTHAELKDWLQVETKPAMALKGISEPVIPHNVTRLTKRPAWLKYD